MQPSARRKSSCRVQLFHYHLAGWSCRHTDGCCTSRSCTSRWNCRSADCDSGNCRTSIDDTIFTNYKILEPCTSSWTNRTNVIGRWSDVIIIEIAWFGGGQCSGSRKCWVNQVLCIQCCQGTVSIVVGWVGHFRATAGAQRTDSRWLVGSLTCT